MNEEAMGTGKNKWGPILAIRVSSRIVHDGRSMIEKAKELTKSKNLEKPKGMSHVFNNFFAVIDNSDLLYKAQGAGISMSNMSLINNNIDAIKHLEEDRLGNFRECNPDMFLPANLDISQEVSEFTTDQVIPGSDESDASQLDDDVEKLSPWVEVFSKFSSSKRKLVFRSNGSRPYMESKRA
jgi:hypothetical protein